MNKTTCYIRRYVCDNGIEYKTKFFVREEASCIRSSRKKEAAVHRAEKSATEAAHELGRVLNCNFKTKVDSHQTLTYSDKGLAALMKKAGTDDPDAFVRVAKKEYDNCLKRVKYRADKMGIEVKAAAVVSISDPETGEAVRIHHHVVVNAEAAMLFAECWKAGEVRGRELYSRYGPDLQELADYMIAQAARVGADKRYTRTRNLLSPLVHKPVKARNPDAELQVPQGCEKIWRSEYKKGRAQHIRYFRPPIVPPEAVDDE